jgi:hypothetical protein
MAAAVDLVVKKNDTTTDITFTVINGSGGEKSPALWRSETVGTALSHRPTFSFASRSNGDGTARRCEGVLKYPSTVTGSDGKVSVTDKTIITISGVIPLGQPTTDTNEGVSQAINLFKSSLILAALKAGQAPT